MRLQRTPQAWDAATLAAEKNDRGARVAEGRGGRKRPGGEKRPAGDGDAMGRGAGDGRVDCGHGWGAVGRHADALHIGDAAAETGGGGGRGGEMRQNGG
jgi:hypothetical protein